MKVSDFKKLIPEKDQQKAIIELLEQIGFVVFRANTGVGRYQNKDGTERFVRYGIPGFPDLFGWGFMLIQHIRYPIPFFCEVKRKGKKPTKAQKDFLARANTDGCLCFWGTYDDIENSLRERNYL